MTVREREREKMKSYRLFIDTPMNAVEPRALRGVVRALSRGGGTG
jgi:hypothetical protein